MTHFQWWEELCKFFQACLIKITKLWGWNLYLTSWVHNFVMEKKSMGNCMIKSSQQILLTPILAMELYCVCMALHYVEVELHPWGAVYLGLQGTFTIKKQNRPPRRHGVVNWGRMLHWSSCSRTQTWVLLPNVMTLFRAALYAPQKTGASALWYGSGMKGYVFLLFV